MIYDIYINIYFFNTMQYNLIECDILYMIYTVYIPRTTKTTRNKSAFPIVEIRSFGLPLWRRLLLCESLRDFEHCWILWGFGDL